MNKSKNIQRVKMFFYRHFQMNNLENKVNDFLKVIQSSNNIINVMQSVGLAGNYLFMTVVYESL